MSKANLHDLHAYLDGELGPEEAAELEAALEADTAGRRDLAAFAHHKARLGQALEALDPAAEDLATARLQRRLARALARQGAPRRPAMLGSYLRTAGQVAAVCALVSLGWIGNSYLGAPSGSVPEYVSEALGAHRVFAEDRIYKAEFTGPAIGAAADWFSEKTGVPLSAPDLSSRGMTLVGARLLGTKEGPLAQFVYENGAGKRWSLTVARHPQDRPVQKLAVLQYPDRAVGFWGTASLDFVIVGEGRAPDLMTLAQDLSKEI